MFRRLAFKKGNIVFIDGFNTITKVDIKDDNIAPNY